MSNDEYQWAPEGAIVAEEEMHFSMPVPAQGLTIEFFLGETLTAINKGLTHWATATDKSETPWVTTLVFYKPKED